MIENTSNIVEDMMIDRTEFISLLEQRFRIGDPEIDMLKQNKHWESFVPHESSGPCYTYNPPEDSDPGYDISLYIKLKMEQFEDSLQIFLHPKNKFYYATKHMHRLNMLYLDSKRLRGTDRKHPRAVSK